MHYKVKFLTSFEQIIFFCMVLPNEWTSTIDNTITCMYKEVHEKTVKF